MRVNTPVSQREYPFPKGETLVSTTDLQGRILYCNEAFIEVSGYTREELLGQPHNLIRHPDMPSEAFRDMWATIQGGQPWSALVKNRRKNGDYYWVQANVTPLLDERGRPNGYMSVRTEASAAATAAAEQLYAGMRAQAAQGRLTQGLHEGLLVNMTSLGQLRRRLQPGLAGRMRLLMALPALLGFGLASLPLPGAPRWLWGLAVAALCAWLGGSYLAGLAIAPLRKLVSFANRMAAGDLTQSLSEQRRDEVGQIARALAQLNVNLMSIVRDARVGVTELHHGTQAISEGNADLSARTETQASNLQQTASSMEQITSTIRASTEMAQSAARHAAAALAVSSNSNQAVAAVARSMESISSASARIADIIQVVDSIAFQTNILALNAAVEAARAGEQGRGFAVVASEVRALAQRTSTAAREVRGLIAESSERVAEGGQQVQQAQQAMGEMQHAVDDMHQLISRISHGMGEQMLGVEQINSAVAQLDTLTQQNAALVEEVSASAMGLNEQAQAVEDSVSVFRLRGHEQRAAPDAVALRRAAKAGLQRAA
ncbi:methyl-accepting chemotaxis protein [Paucibacter sediminis]|uniref:Methyl-accepting chemotaxis protein n=1 Tax=Paucibacter sediminis TaxID=3019553 RepID=A0AA95NCQ1_9BURK|nr:PAS domain-containing methyl-accepting chemotaxis protein [Paucibacter sp. S2-9]WIT09764.1 methyl-accepting chemotaxis protein [Paucibacter sp. S2-9]